jgi:hypothetical protein
MNRREFITLLGGAVVWPLAARAQQSAMPVVGFLNSASPEAFPDRLRAFHRGLKDTGFVEGENVAIVYRWAENQFDRELHVLRAGTESEVTTAFATLQDRRVGALVIGPDTFFNSRIEQLAALSVRHRLPAVYQFREFAAAGGLMSYGGSLTDTYRQVGRFVGRILKGDKPADLPVQQTVKIQLFINFRTAKALGLTIPITLLGRADEVIE